MSDIFFESIITAKFLRRPNRFIVECLLNGEERRAYLPNPGRLWELLFPGTLLYLTANGPEQKTPFTVVGVDRDGQVIMLHTHKTNDVVHRLLRERRIPGLEEWTVVRPEVSVGKHRFDFLLQRQGKPFYLEVKSCTLFEGALAMFPDAVTERGRQHLEALAHMAADDGIDCGVLFLVQWPRAQCFLPDYHTDYAFARTFLAVKDRLWMSAVAISWNQELRLDEGIGAMTIPWGFLDEEVQDGGCYLLLLTLDKETPVTIGKLGERTLPPGHYVYVGSARKNLTQRVERHLRKRKNFHWHIDYLRDRASRCTALAVRTTEDLECTLAAAVQVLAVDEVAGFGASDCRCTSHLFRFDAEPVRDRRFMAMVQHFRMGRLEERLLHHDER
ncbi:DNA/RNA nuclease SfsA [Heliophilum fasciatum]|uniref:Sugar fermentation stimulation protein homolog n=1 Tax=Heliophilum fasciatum TaxID=35700 RepID=A0A4R2RFQ1_9FIRM|nr:DNA/RNA nuclease SfsA [Heliophilum fasciatum]MCW2278779.1 sugar fermentation stimulation protein A [Heliophilum fasciatum]TCP62450.1 sugar fermentation stimulation protein A [Heliophilum fasciatum]